MFNGSLNLTYRPVESGVANLVSVVNNCGYKQTDMSLIDHCLAKLVSVVNNCGYKQTDMSLIDHCYLAYANLWAYPKDALD